MNQITDLEAAGQAFAQWHQERASVKSKTPAALRAQALALLPHYRKSVVAKALGIRSENLRRWSLATDKDTPSQHQKQDSAFIALPAEQQCTAGELSLNLTFKRGEQLQLTGDVPAALILSLVEAVAGGARR